MNIVAGASVSVSADGQYSFECQMLTAMYFKSRGQNSPRYLQNELLGTGWHEVAYTVV